MLAKIDCQVAAWRYPAILPSDFQVWVAQPLPPGVKLVPHNAIIVTMKAASYLNLGGADLDGDKMVVAKAPGQNHYSTIRAKFCMPQGSELSL